MPVGDGGQDSGSWERMCREAVDEDVAEQGRKDEELFDDVFEPELEETEALQADQLED